MSLIAEIQSLQRDCGKGNATVAKMQDLISLVEQYSEQTGRGLTGIVIGRFSDDKDPRSRVNARVTYSTRSDTIFVGGSRGWFPLRGTRHDMLEEAVERVENLIGKEIPLDSDDD